MDQFIIDKEKKVIFVQVPKTASSSLRGAFTKHHKEAIVDLVDYRHQHLQYYKDTVEDFEDYKVYAVVRNPFYQTVSWYTHKFSLEFGSLASEKTACDQENIRKFVDEYIIPYDMHLMQSGFITIEGKIPENLHIFRYEDGFYNIIHNLKQLHGYKLSYRYQNRCLFKHNKNKILENDLLRESIQSYLSKEFELLGYSKEL